MQILKKVINYENQFGLFTLFPVSPKGEKHWEAVKIKNY
jgi:hypothetical protein